MVEAMNWDALGAIAETFGALAVVATLLYLSLQIRQNSKVLTLNEKAFTAQENREAFNALTALNVNTMNSTWYWPVFEKLVDALPPGKVLLIAHAVQDTRTEDWAHALEQLTFEERGRFFFSNLTQWNNCQNLFFQQTLSGSSGAGLRRVKWLIDVQVTKWNALGIPLTGNSEFHRYCENSLKEADA